MYLFESVFISVCIGFDLSKHLSTKSPYSLLGDQLQQSLSSNCLITQIQLISRHGTRNPSERDIESINTLMRIGKASDLAQDFTWIKAWLPPYNVGNNMMLTKEGKDELYHLGKRTRLRYPSIFQFHYTPLKFAFHNSPTSRTYQSASAYSLGLFGGSECNYSSNSSPIIIDTYSKDEGFLLEPKSSCTSWKDKVKNNQLKPEQIKRFIVRNIPHIAKRLTKALNSTISAEDVLAIYKACAYEVSLKQSTKWCPILAEKDIFDLEYLEDLDYYYTYGYGNSFNARMSCSLISDFIKKIEDYSNNNSFVLGDFQFGHSQTIQFLVTALGLFKDDFKLTWNLNDTLKQKRRFKTSQISPFASNIFIETYKCGADLKVRFLANEMPVKLPACSSVFCPFDELKSILKPLIGCNHTELCL